MRIAVTGSSGLIGSALVRSLTADGHQVVRLVRHAPKGPEEVHWDPQRQQVDSAGLAGVEAVVHLAGAGVGDHRWTDAYKREIRDSRVLGTAALAEALAGLATPPSVLVSGSAIGFYGQTGDRVVDETAPPGGDFLARVCQEWEEAAQPAAEAGIRVVHPRTGLVVASGGGAWARMFPLFRMGLGGRMGSGDQYWSFVSLRDEVAALRFLVDTEGLSGPVNLTAPEPVTNREVTAAMGRVLRRPTPFPVPEAALRAVLGEFAVEVVGSHRVVPAKLLEAGFRFSDPTIDEAVRAAL
ncbi:TIGR01777 family oxidoreductase [Streptacidiphilus sp. ASG 303]|uniref:TIGR01777 family oxidoreductase n=1 Tax=Streptomycetaceae TaxID=2062 RepID=UPI001E2D2653|nr:TIGR01777 family oxidoreductase [Streptacidiphilus sp. ASG 303]MCD0481727.1 TIGR01777 family oxidoreductase [Streptacidiphilus sp. ASG 303]